jgi:beta-1,4-mannosyltransferase
LSEPARSDDASPRASDHGGRELDVVFIPDMRSSNPYQRLLAAALEERGIRPRFPGDFGPRRPLLRALFSGQIEVLHLDWIHPYITGKSLGGSVLRSAVFLAKVCLVRLLRRRIVWTVHNLVSHEARFASWERWVNATLARLAHCLVVHFPDARLLVRESFRIGAKKEILVAHHGNYVRVYGEVSYLPTHRDQTPQPVVFMAFGLVRRYKRLEELIAAFKTLDRGDIRLTIKGEAIEREYAEELKRLTEDDVRITLELGFIDDRMVPVVFAAADVVVLPQTQILTSGSLILAMSMGKPVVAAREPHAEFLVGDEGGGGVLYAPGSITGLAGSLRQMADRREELPGMGAANMRRIAPYTWSAMAEEMERAYRGAG